MFATTSTTPSCTDLIYPYTLCATSYRPELCAALNTPYPGSTTIYKIPYGSRTVDATFKRVSPDASQETAKTYYPSGALQSVMTFRAVTQAQIDSPALCPKST
ncbi:MAG: hypothetical protein ABR499_15090 [Gemmatimonadaceae bacterium]